MQYEHSLKLKQAEDAASAIIEAEHEPVRLAAQRDFYRERANTDVMRFNDIIKCIGPTREVELISEEHRAKYLVEVGKTEEIAKEFISYIMRRGEDTSADIEKLCFSKNEDIKSLRIPCKRTIAELEEEAATEAYFEICEKNFAVYDSYLDEYYKACDSAKFILECDQKEAGHI